MNVKPESIKEVSNVEALIMLDEAILDAGLMQEDARAHDQCKRAQEYISYFFSSCEFKPGIPVKDYQCIYIFKEIKNILEDDESWEWPLSLIKAYLSNK